MEISKTQARHTVIASQGLNKESVSSEIINQLGYVQIDTLSVAERAHHHVFQTRNPKYAKADLDTLMHSKQVFEYWSHAAAYLPMADFRFSLIKKSSFVKGTSSHWFPKDKKISKYVLDRVNAEGPIQSKNFKDTRDKPGAWHDYKPAKIALEQLFMEGKLMIAERRSFQKVYDLTERVLPKGINTLAPSMDEYCEYLVTTTLKSQGIATLSEIGYLRKGIKPVLSKTVKRLLETGEVASISIEGDTQDYFALPNEIILEKLNKEVHILSPFDNLVIQRKRLQTIFDFVYQIECYVPEAKRKFGYYCLPVLYGDQFVARFDPKADRKTGIFTVKKIWFEVGFTPDDEFYFKFSEKLIQFALFCGCDKVIISLSSPDLYKKILTEALKR